MNLFILQKSLSEGVMRSQVIALINKLNINGTKNYLMLHDSEYHIYADSLDSIIVYDDYIKELKNISEEIEFIYVRTYFIFIKLYIFKLIYSKSFKIVFDFRGLASAESFAKNKSKIKRFILLQLEFFVYKKADSIHCVSNYLKEWLINRWGEKEISVFPCCVSSNLKKLNNYNNNVKFVYSGGIASWQKIESIIDLYIAIENQIPNSLFTVLTKEEETVINLLKKKKVKNFHVKCLKQDQVLNELVNHDFGFLLRDDILMNNCASPVKFAEYISRGVVPIISKGVGDYSKLVEDNGLGLVVSLDDLSVSKVEIMKKFKNDNLTEKLFLFSENLLWNFNHKPFFV
jgi:glycosyltransferase involved in cell wall biosynthesis